MSQFDDFIRDNYISHYGVAHDANPPTVGSGRYEFGSGERPHQHDWDLYSRIKKLKAEGLTDSQIARELGYFKTNNKGDTVVDYKTGEAIPDVAKLKAMKQAATNQVKIDTYERIATMFATVNPATGKLYTNAEIARELGIPDSTVRSAKTSAEKGNNNKTFESVGVLKEAIADCIEGGYILDVGAGTELSLDISKDRLQTVLALLKEEGYGVYNLSIKQLTSSNGQRTTITVLCPPGMTYEEAVANKLNTRSLETLGTDFDKTMNDIATNLDPVRVDINRVGVVFAEEGGTERDGMIQLRAVRDENGNLVPACEDLSIGNAKYAQVRIATDTGKFIKGMAVYSDQLPDGVDILVNSNKSIEKGVDGALKDLKVNKETGELETNCFGATVIQTHYIDSNGERKNSAINIVGVPTEDNSDAHVEGRWGEWSKNLPAQFLAKQSLALVQQQLKLKVKQTEAELAEIEAIENPVIRKKQLQAFADECDSAAVDLKAAALAGQATHAILPVKSLKDTEIYAPNYANGTQVACIRYPHAGPFEIAVLTVNNNNKEAKSFMKDALDAVGINHNTADKLSGADFDGDTVTVIPLTRKDANGEIVKITSIKSAASLPGLKGFTTEEYGVDSPINANKVKIVNGEKIPTYKVPTNDQKQKEMGIASNLITDMYAKGCDNVDDITRAVKYSMIVIDSEKHKLNYTQAYKDLNIEELKQKYQKKVDVESGKGYGGASSLLSRSKSTVTVDARQINYDIDKETGEKIFRAPTQTTQPNMVKVKVSAPAGATWRDSSGKLHKGAMKDSDGRQIYETTDGKLVKNSDGTYSYDKGSGRTKFVQDGYKKRTQASTQMYETNDASTLLSTNPNKIELAYRDYANHMKTLANQVRKESLSVETPKKDPVAAKTYAKEVESLKEKLKVAQSNRTRERQAQILATSIRNAAYQNNPNMDKDHAKKLKATALKQARDATGASKTRVKFTEKEWEACTKNAVSSSFFNQLLENSDQDHYMSLASPKSDSIGTAKRSWIKSLRAAGYTQEEIARTVGVSQSSVSSILGS